jgi:hypothetical protein
MQVKGFNALAYFGNELFAVLDIPVGVLQLVHWFGEGEGKGKGGAWEAEGTTDVLVVGSVYSMAVCVCNLFHLQRSCNWWAVQNEDNIRSGLSRFQGTVAQSELRCYLFCTSTKCYHKIEERLHKTRGVDDLGLETKLRLESQHYVVQV